MVFDLVYRSGGCAKIWLEFSAWNDVVRIGFAMCWTWWLWLDYCIYLFSESHLSR